MRFYEKFRGILATVRVANVPSVLSNLGVGVFLAMMGGGDGGCVWCLGLAGVLFYVSGNFLNDWADREWDVVSRPERALPRGVFSSGMYLGLGVVGMVVGLGMVAMSGVLALAVGVVLCGLIVLYTWVHKKVAWGVVPMGLCRACLPVMGFVGVAGTWSWLVMWPSMALFFYVMGLSMSARGEARGERSLLGEVFLWVSCAVGAVLGFLIEPLWAWAGVMVFGIWLVECVRRYRSPVAVHVSALLAGIPLVDGLFLLPFALGSCGSVEGWVAVGLVVGCFVGGRVLQRVAPAT